MAEINEYTLHQRQILMFVLVCVFVITICAVTLSILIIDPALIEEEAAYSGKQHFLLIVVDDLRPVLGCYGDEKAITPNIDQLAARSILFKNAYTQQALDGPSRISFLTGRRPDNLHLYDEGFYWRDFVGDFVTLPQHFKNHGYETVSVGKVFAPGLLSNETDDYPQSWSRVPYHPPSEDLEEFCLLPDNETAFNLICPVKLDQTSLPDIESTEFAIDFLKNKSREENKTGPFFLAVGYNKPHIPFKFPKEYLDLYPLESMDLAINHTIPPRLPKISWNPWMDIREKDDVKNLNVNFPYGPLPEDLQKRIRQAYYSSVSYIDDQIGKILNALEESKFADYTTIVLLGDNGWSLGEHQEWSKYSNFEVALRVPLLVYIPELMEKEREPFHHIPVIRKQTSTFENSPSLKSSNPSAKYVTEELVELVDVFPTLAEIANIAIPPICRLYLTNFCSEGLSFFPLVQHLIIDPWIDFSWKQAAFSQYPRPSLVAQNNSDRPSLEDINYMGYSIRTADFHYTEWLRFDVEELKPEWPVIISRELYDHRLDPHEINNVCDDDEYSNTMIELSKRLKKGWHHAMPPGSFDDFFEN